MFKSSSAATKWPKRIKKIPLNVHIALTSTMHPSIHPCFSVSSQMLRQFRCLGQLRKHRVAQTQTRRAGSGHSVEECMRRSLASWSLGRLFRWGITQGERTAANFLSVAGELTGPVVGDHRRGHRDGL